MKAWIAVLGLLVAASAQVTGWAARHRCARARSAQRQPRR